MTYSEHVTTEALADHAEGLLGESEAGKVAAHLEGCADCRSTALMLESLSAILAADDPGPMPAQYVARINATLADLAISEPVVPSETAAAPPPAAAAAAGGAQVIDLAARRKLMVTGLRRVSTVAASVVLLIGGVTLGVQTINNRGEQSGTGAEPQPQAAGQVPTIAMSVFDIPTNAVPDNHGNYVAPNGTIYVPGTDKKAANKVIQPNGDVIVKSTNGHPIVEKPQAAVAPKGAGQPQPLIQPAPNTTQKAQTTKAQDPAAPATTTGPSNVTPPPAVPSQPSPTPNAGAPASNAAGPAAGPAAVAGPTPAAKNNNQVHSDTFRSGPTEGDPYVTQSGSAYSEDNFAAKVMDLVSDAQQHPGPNDKGRPTAAGAPAVSDPAEPAAGPSDITTSQTTTTTKHLGNRRDVTTDYAAPSDAMKPAAHGPASFGVQARVLRCAALTHRQAIAGDEGTWGDRRATIVVVQSDNADQVIGYVFYGDCNHSGQVTAQESPWEQRVDRPGTQAAAQSTTPPKRVGDVTGSQNQVKSSAPATNPPVGSGSVTPDEQQS